MKNRIRIPVLVCALLSVYISCAHADVNDHVLRIEMSTTYKFGTTSMTPIEYCFDAWMEVDKTVVSGSVETPGGVVYPAELEIDGRELWLGIGHCSVNLGDLADFTTGTYTFTVNYKKGNSDSTTVDYSLANGAPIPPVDQPLEANYPTLGAVGVPQTITVGLDPLTNPDWTYSVIWGPEDEDSTATSGEVEGLAYTTTSVGPITLSSNTLYEMELNAGHAIWSVNSDGIPYVVDMDSERFLYFTTEPELTITKFTAKAGKLYNQDQAQFKGLMDAAESDILDSNEIIVSIDASYIPDPNNTTWTFPVNGEAYKNGKYNYARTENASQSFLKYDPANGKVQFKVKNEDLTGLSCPMMVTITIGDYTAQIELDEDIVNGTKKPCPPEFLMGAVNSFMVDKNKVKFGKTTGADSLTVSGFFTIAADYDTSNPFVITLGSQTFTVPGDQFIAKGASESCNASCLEGGLLKAKLDFAKCTYILTLSQITIDQYDVVPFGVDVFGFVLGGPGVPRAEVDLGAKQAYSFWELTANDQPTAWWDYTGLLERTVEGRGSNIFRVEDDESDAWAEWDFQKQGESAYLKKFAMIDDLDEEITIDNFSLLYYPGTLKLGQSHTAEDSFTGDIDIPYYPLIDLSGTVKTTVSLSSKFTRVTYGGTAYSAVQLTEVLDILANIHNPYDYSDILGKMKLKLTTKSFFVPGLGATSFTRKATISGAGMRFNVSQKAVLDDTNMD